MPTSLKDWLKQAFHLFKIDPPDTDFQRGYLAALKEVAKEFYPKENFNE